MRTENPERSPLLPLEKSIWEKASDAAEFYDTNIRDINQKMSEADLQIKIVAPLLGKLGYTNDLISYQVMASTKGTGAPDICIFQKSQDLKDATNKVPGNPAILIGELKRPGADIDKTDSRENPFRQLERYLLTHNHADKSTRGFLTNGKKWRIYEKDAEDNVIEIARLTEPESSSQVCFRDSGSKTEKNPEDFFFILAESQETQHPQEPDLIRQFLQALENTPVKTREKFRKPARILLANKADKPKKLTKPKDARSYHASKRDWVPDTAWLYAGPRIRENQDPLIAHRGIGASTTLHVGFVQLRPECRNIQKADIANARRGFSQHSGKAPILICAVIHKPDNQATARIGFFWSGRTLMTSEFQIPNAETTPRKTLELILEEITSQEPDPEKIAEHFSLAPLQKRFYDDISIWIGKVPGWNSSSGGGGAKASGKQHRFPDKNCNPSESFAGHVFLDIERAENHFR